MPTCLCRTVCLKTNYRPETDTSSCPPASALTVSSQCAVSSLAQTSRPSCHASHGPPFLGRQVRLCRAPSALHPSTRIRMCVCKPHTCDFGSFLWYCCIPTHRFILLPRDVDLTKIYGLLSVKGHLWSLLHFFKHKTALLRYSAHAMKFTFFKVYSSVIFSTFRKLYKCHCFRNIFAPERSLMPIALQQ